MHSCSLPDPRRPCCADLGVQYIIYWFYTDLEAPNKLDAKPFFEFNLLEVREQDVEELKKFTKPAFDVNGILNTASELKYTREIQRIMAEQLQEPSEEFVKFFTSQVYAGRMTQAIREQFTQTVRRALKQFINDQINERLKTALATEVPTTTAEQPATQLSPAETKAAQERPTAVTTVDEMQGYYIVKAILHEVVDPKRIAMRDVQTYCSVLLDDNNRKPICRLRFNAAQKYLGLFDNEEKKETTVHISGLDEIYQYADRLKATVGLYTK